MKHITFFGRLFFCITTLILLCPNSGAAAAIDLPISSKIKSDMTAIEGERIFFIRKRNVNGLLLGDIYSMKPDGSDVQRITNFSDNFFVTEQPQISRDGRSLAFISNYESWKSAFYTDAFIIDLQKGFLKRVTGYEQKTPAVDFGTVSVTVDDPKRWAVSPSAIRISYKGCSSFIIGNSAEHAFPFNDGSMLAFCTGKHTLNSLAIVRTDDFKATPTILAYGSSFGTQAFCAQPTWSPDGSDIVFVYTSIATSLMGTKIQSNLYKVSINGEDPVQVTSFSGNEVVSKPSFSPDGNSIAFSLLKSFDDVFMLSDLINNTYNSDIYSIPTEHASLTKGKATPVALTNDGNSIDPSWGFVYPSVGVSERRRLVESFQLFQNFPNPFNTATNIEYEIQELTHVTIEVYDLLGQLVAVLFDGTQPAGHYRTSWYGKDFYGNLVPSGIYIYKIAADGLSFSRRMVLQR